MGSIVTSVKARFVLGLRDLGRDQRVLIETIDIDFRYLGELP